MPSDGIINSKTLFGQLRPFKTHYPLQLTEHIGLVRSLITAV
jgi:hypothetical protein